MIIHQREVSYQKDYKTFFDALVNAKNYLENKFPEVSIELMYNLAGQRGRVSILTRYASLADYERIDSEMDKDEEYVNLIQPLIGEGLPVDQFYRVI